MASRKAEPAVRAKRSARKAPGPVDQRPPYRPTNDERDTVEQMKFCGEKDATIARALRISTAMLREHYAVELEDGPARKQKEVIGLLFKSARDSGNVSALKQLAEVGKIAGAARAIDQRGRPKKKVEAEAPAPLGAKPGKKEARQAAANAIGGKFAPPEPPKLIVDNVAAAAGGK